ncbi:MAG: M23 family metallopeptidase [Chloroflexi bacterium]|nr:M23 family metallopeptidase [Chloroflexota bacterium]
MKKITSLKRWLQHPLQRLLILGVIGLIGVAGLYMAYRTISYLRYVNDPRNDSFFQWASGDATVRENLVTVQREACPGVPFILPADGFIGLLYEDPRGPYSKQNPHQGIDIFSNTQAGITPVYAAYNGYVTREDDWRSTLIMRVPRDPLNSERQIWLYYTHMADRAGNDFIVDAFSPGTHEQFVEQGTLLGYTGNYNGDSARSVWVHLHFSIVQDDGNGRYTNEIKFNNTIDPSPYLGMALNFKKGGSADGCVELQQ